MLSVARKWLKNESNGPFQAVVGLIADQH